MSKYLIYGLYCPFTDSLHYIGKSSKYMLRPLEYLTNSHSDKINLWVSHLKVLGYKPIIKIIEECDENTLADREYYWIKKSINDKCYLLNIAHNNAMEIIIQSEYTDNAKNIVTIGITIRNKRKELKITQEQLCNSVGISRVTLSKLENGSTNITLGILNSILSVLKCNIIINNIK